MSYSRPVHAFLLTAFLLTAFAFRTAATPRLEYTVAMEAPQTHFFEIETTVHDVREKFVDLKMATWTPGSYLIREYARHVEDFSASAGGQALRAEKINKNTWRVYTNRAAPFKVKYKLYAYELTVRTNFLDASHGYINGASTFLYVANRLDLPATVTIKPYANWNQISTGLSPAGSDKWVLKSPNYDILADSPIEIGNQEIFTFRAAGVNHEVAFYGNPPYNQAKLKADMAKVTEAATAVVGVNPNQRYVFITHFGPGLGGGLEHLNSTSLQARPLALVSPAGYKSFLGLVAHEYFHLWNVKRIRPVALGPFDYENENYTHMLWVSEGFTSYYSGVLLRQANIYAPQEFLDSTASSFTGLENIPGNKVQSAYESSFDAWIKNYRPNENSRNSTISYYSRGSVIGALLDLEIIHATRGQKSLDDVFRLLWIEYYEKRKRGFTDTEFQLAAEKVAGHSLQTFFRDYILDTKTFDYNQYLGYAGLQLTDRNAGLKRTFLGASVATTNNKLVVTGVQRDSPAWRDGINVNDEILAVNGNRVGTNLNILNLFEAGDRVKITVSRGEKLQDLEVTLSESPVVHYRISKLPTQTPAQQVVYNKWLRLKTENGREE